MASLAPRPIIDDRTCPKLCLQARCMVGCRQGYPNPHPPSPMDPHPSESGSSSPPPSGDAADPGSTSQSGHRSATNCLRDAISRAWECGSTDARRTAQESIPKARAAATEFAVDLAYGLSFGAAFAATVLDQLGAKDAVHSSEQGGEAGRKAAQEILRRFRHRPSTPPPGDPDPGAHPAS